MKSNSTSKERTPYGIGEVVSPLAVRYSVMCHQWLTDGARASRVFPTICIQRCTVSRESFHSASPRLGQVPCPRRSVMASVALICYLMMASLLANVRIRLKVADMTYAAGLVNRKFAVQGRTFCSQASRASTE